MTKMKTENDQKWQQIKTENEKKWPKIKTENDKNDMIWHKSQNGEIHQKIAKLVNQNQQLIDF